MHRTGIVKRNFYLYNTWKGLVTHWYRLCGNCNVWPLQRNTWMKPLYLKPLGPNIGFDPDPVKSIHKGLSPFYVAYTKMFTLFARLKPLSVLHCLNWKLFNKTVNGFYILNAEEPEVKWKVTNQSSCKSTTFI